MRRIRFVMRVAAEGVRWAVSVLNPVLLIIAVVGVTGGVVVAGVLLHRPAWFLGVFAALVVLVVLGEGAYRTWQASEQRAQSAPHGAAGVSLLDQLRLDLKRGQGLAAQASQSYVPDPALLALARGWHDSIYKRLLLGGHVKAAEAWLQETSAVPEIASINLGGLPRASEILKEQVQFLKGIINDLEAATPEGTGRT